MTQMQASAALGISQGTLSQAERAGESSGLVAKFAALYGVNPLWLTDESAEMQPVVAAAPAAPGEPRDILHVTRVDWGDWVAVDLSARFEVELPNDALAPEYPKGVVMRFDPGRERRAGWPCIVKDAAGHFHVRDYEEGFGGAWRAVARSRGFAPLDSEAHGLVFVASMFGVDYC